MIECPRCKSLYTGDSKTCSSCKFAPENINGFAAWAPEMAWEGGGFKAEYFEQLVSYEAGNFWFRARNALIVWLLKRYSPDMASFLEVGCGTGFVLQGLTTAFPNAKLSGSEIFVEGLEFAAKRVPGTNLFQMDARRTPFVDEFDAVGAFDVIEHIKEDELVLQNLARALKPNGILAVSVPQHEWLWSPADDFACHERRYKRGELEAKIEATGLEVLRSTSFVSLLLPAMAYSRWRARSDTAFDPNDEFKMSPALNSIFKFIMDIERFAIKAGVNFPAGGSRIVIARRPKRI